MHLGGHCISDALHLVRCRHDEPMFPRNRDDPDVIDIDTKADQVGLGLNGGLWRSVVLPYARDDLGIVPPRRGGNRQCIGQEDRVNEGGRSISLLLVGRYRDEVSGFDLSERNRACAHLRVRWQ